MTNVCWSFNDTLLVTTGGADMSVVVWQLRQRGSEAESEVGKNQEEGGTGSQDEEKISLIDDLPDEGKIRFCTVLIIQRIS